ncbi:hypothetical protein BC628DRAFT_1322941 [Trametes gibbosa]|nr:hypothetical protein BC628DRAFT_1322941 [Trametes gibbosa]
MTVTFQPHEIVPPSLSYFESNEKGCPHGHNQDSIAARRRHCEGARLRRVLIAFLLAILTFALLLFISFLWNAAFNEASWLSYLGLTDDGSGSAWTGMTGFVKRQAINNGTGENTFIHRKYYLIVVFVGLFLVILAAICLSAWCCRGAFQNPLCCPCYLCACCGGLACLECIGCGLCAEGIDNV